jgi:hypothetical protein
MPTHQGSAASDLDDEAYLQLSNLLHQLREARVAVGLARRLLRHALPRAGRLLSYLRQLPVLRVEVSDSPAGRANAEALTRRRGVVPSPRPTSSGAASRPSAPA